MNPSPEKLKKIMNTLRNTSTGVLDDALALLGINGSIMGVRPMRGFEEAKIVGPAVTILFAPPRSEDQTLSNYQIMQESDPGSVIVIDGKGLDRHFAGDNNGACAKVQGLEAIVIYGGARDIPGFREVGMPVYSMGSATTNKPKELKATACNVPIEIGGTTVKPKDIVVGDEDGVVVIPENILEDLMEKIKIINEVEEEMEQAIKSKGSFKEIKAIIAKKTPKK